MGEVNVNDLREQMKKKIRNRTYNVRDIMEILGIGETAAYRLMKQEDFPGLYLGGKYLVPVPAFEKWFEGAYMKANGGRG